MLEDFRDRERGGLYLTPEHLEDLIARPRDTFDGAIPSAGSVAAFNLLRLARMTGQPGFEDVAEEVFLTAADQMESSPTSSTHLLSALDFGLGPSQEFVVVGRQGDERVAAFLKSIRSGFTPHRTVLLRDPFQEPDVLLKLCPFTRAMDLIGGKAAVYLCEKSRCKTPITHPEVLEKELGQ
jgi:uncharacterized protein YyaL (SSP411 family)